MSVLVQMGDACDEGGLVQELVRSASWEPNYKSEVTLFDYRQFRTLASFWNWVISAQTSEKWHFFNVLGSPPTASTISGKRHLSRRKRQLW